MTLWDEYDDVLFEVVRNDEGHYSIWPTTQRRPDGWQPVGAAATKDECLTEIELRWTNPRPSGGRVDGSPPVGYQTTSASVVVGPVKPRPALPIHLLIEQADGLAGTAVAMRCGDVALTRAELFQTVRTWAAVLAQEGCGPEVPVVVLVRRGLDALVAILAVLYAGGAYVPLRCDDSTAERDAILEDCGYPLVVAADEMAARMGSYRGRVIGISGLRARSGDQTGLAPVAVPMTSLAFIIYTSGTTGRPKGVEGTHRQLVNYALWCREAFGHRPGEWHVLHAPLSFLGSLTNIFTPLLAGWPIEIVPDGATIDDLMALLDRLPVGLVKLTPTHVRMMLARGVARRRVARQFMIGSEPLVLTDAVAEWVGNDPSATYVNHYGLTETHGCFCHWFGPGVPVGEVVPIGRPIDNVRAHIVDRHGDDVPQGELGELLVAGASIARGYHRRPRLTAQRWVPDRFGAPGDRILRTGDLARLRPDGNVEIVGRVDRQVKIRGNRVEPGAVEHALRTYPDVVEALVLPRQYDGTTTLAAYLIARKGATLDPAAVHRALADRLPSPAVPGRIAVLADFPTNANGKLDVAALPDAPPIRPTDDTTSNLGRWTRYDLIVADAFATSLGIDTVGLHDDFFELGGDSLSAVTVAVAVGKRLGGDVPVPTTGCGTVRSYAQLAAQAQAESE